MKINWGAKIAILYLAFVGLIVTLVTSSMRQKFDLVSDDYYKKELEFQHVIDASANGSKLSAKVTLQANGDNLLIIFPPEFNGKTLSGTIDFYSPVNSAFDNHFDIQTADNRMEIPRSKLHKTTYQVKIAWSETGKKYYQELTFNNLKQ